MSWPGRSCIAEVNTYIYGSDEHYRRSPGCAFFVFAGTTAPKMGRAKKARTSKVSRLSTQSNATNASQAQSIPDFNDSIDVSNISQDSVLSAMSMTSKKGAKGKGRSTRVKKAEPIEVVIVRKETNEDDVRNLDLASRGKKRKSEEIDEDHRSGRESTVKPEPLPKRRATRSRNSETQQIDYPILDALENVQQEPVRGGRKRASSRSRKVSTASAATTASLRAPIPDDAEIEAALEADLDKPMPDLPPTSSEASVEGLKPKGKGRGKKTNASTALARSTRQATAESEILQGQTVKAEEPVLVQEVDTESKADLKGKGGKPRVTKKTVNKRTTPSGRDSHESTAALATNAEPQLNSSLITIQTTVDDSGHETDASVASQKSVTRKGSRRKGTAKTKGKKKGLMSKNIEDIVQTKPGSESVAEQTSTAEADPSSTLVGRDLDEDHVAEEATKQEKPKKVTRATKGRKVNANTTAKAKTKFPQLSMPGMFSPLMGEMDPSFNSVLANSSPPVAPITRSGLGADDRIPSSLAQVSSPRLPELADDTATPANPKSTPAKRQTSTPQRNKNANAATPSPSPQSSDAENQPPSSRPPSARPPLASLSPVKGAIQNIPLAPGTPRQVPLSPSKIGGLRSRMPWTAVDVEMIFAPSPDKENRNIFAGIQKAELTSPEKVMSVEEWVRSQASGAEEELKAEAERIVSIFEREGGRALGVLEAIDIME